MHWSFGIYHIGRHYCDYTSDIESQWLLEFDKVSMIKWVNESTSTKQFSILKKFSNIFRQNIQRQDLYQYRLQAWNMSNNMDETYLPDFSQSKYISTRLLPGIHDFSINLLKLSEHFSDWRNLITYCYIHNDSTVELSKCGTMIASFEVASSKKIISKQI